MDEDFDKMLELMEVAFRDFEAALPGKPKLTRKGDRYVYRFLEQDIYQALVQKLAHAQSGVRAARVLLENGFVQEQAALQRVVDETNEDILFLVYAITNDRVTELHERYLAAFWQEEFEGSGSGDHKRRPMPPRKKIHAYLANVQGAPLNPSRAIELSKKIYGAYSGFIHGASPHVMDRYGGDPPQFHIKGMLGTQRIEEHRLDLWNYMYRTYISHVLIAKAFGASRHVDTMTQHLKVFERNAGKNYSKLP